jgi:hypothetical protein
VIVKVANQLWVATDVEIDLGTGAAKSILRLVGSDDQATPFGRKSAQNIKGFVETRVNNLSETPVKFSLRPSKTAVGLWVVYGIQEFELDSES